MGIQGLMKNGKPFGLLLFLPLFVSCEIFDPEEEVPSYIHIEAIDLTVKNPNQEGSASQAITDAWVFYNDELIGAFELPTTFPILAEGSGNLQIFPGIKNNGIASTRAVYPFYSTYELNSGDFNLERGKVTNIDPNPVVNYAPDLDFAMNLGMEFQSEIPFEAHSSSDTGFVLEDVPELVFEGKGSAKIALDETNTFFRVLTLEKLNLPQGGVTVYLEMDYKNTVNFGVGLRINSNLGFAYDNPIVGLNPSEADDGTFEWNKIYIDLTGIVSFDPNAETFQLYFEGSNNGRGQDEIFIDNLKIIHP